MKKQLFAFAGMFVMLACAALDLPMRNYYRFDSRVWLTGSQHARNNISLAAGEKYAGHGVVKMVHKGSKSSFYSGMSMPGVAGRMQVKFNVKADAPADCTLGLNFNKKNGGNGSAGVNHQPFSVTKDWQSIEMFVEVPADTYGMQFVFSFSGKENTFYVNNVYFGFAPDKVEVPVRNSVNFLTSLTHHTWNPKPPVAGFQAVGAPAVAGPTVQVTADKKAVYFAFKNPTNPVRAKFKGRDEHLWLDDCNEIFLFNAAINKGWHFTVNSNGAFYDALVYQKQDGDPWRDDPAWNSKQSKVYAVKGKDGWESRIMIAWSDLGLDPAAGFTLGLNVASENKSVPEDSTWNFAGGSFHEPAKYGKLTVADGKVILERNRQADNFSYTIKRANPKFDSLLEKGVPGNYLIGAWSAGADKGGFSKNLLAKVGEEGFLRWQNDLMHAYGKAHMFGPALPWLPNYLNGGEKFKSKEAMYDFNKKYGMKYPWSIHSSAHDRMSREQGAVYILARDSRKVSPVDPVLINMMTNYIKNLPKDRNYPLYKMTSFVMGMDEPFNGYTEIFSKTLNNKNIAALNELDAKIKKEFGCGIFGLFDDFGADDKDIAFKRIATCRWINAEFLRANKLWKAELNKALPGVPLMMGNNNTCGGLAPMDYALFDGHSDILGVDPYPTSAKYNFGASRAIYHTGFTARMLNDLAPRALTLVMPQAFIYCSGRPVPSDLREWANQALKNGADGFMWYCADAPSNLYDCFLEMFSINKFVAKMDKIKMPANPDCAIFFSNYDNYALRDNVVHAAYSLYGILGEQLKGNFRFVSGTGLARNLDKLENYKVVYAPRLAYTDKELTAKLVAYVKQGGTLVVFDPRFLSWNIDGTAVAERQLLTGVEKVAPRAPVKEIICGGLKLPMTPNAHIKLPTGMQVESYAVGGKITGKVYARYPDNSPAAIVNTLGKGKVIYFAAHPFGNSDLGIDGGNWKKFFTNIAKEHGCQLDLPIWDFMLPEDRLEKIDLKQLK